MMFCFDEYSIRAPAQMETILLKFRVEFVISKTSSVFCVQCGRIADGKRSNVTVVRILFPVQAPPLNKVVLSSLKLRASHDLMSLHDRRGGLMGLVGAW